MPKKDDDELVIPTELLEKDPTELANNEEELQTVVSYLQKKSEEHTSELQSPCNLVCRLLLEKKKTKQTIQ